MSEKSKSIFGKLIDTADKNHTCIYINFSSGEDIQINVIQKNEKSAEINDDNNKKLTLLLSDIQSQFKQQGISLNRVQGQPEGKRKLTAELKTDKVSLSETEVALQKMQFRALELGAELVLTDRPAEMANERWRLPAVSGQENRSESMTAAEGLAKLAVAVQAVTDQCPLQITLMIQPDLRPQVILNVSAGEVNWIFAATEGRYPVKDLLAKMAGKTITNGWDAVVVYQRGQANMLLKQQHIKWFVTGNVLAPLNEDIDSSDATRLQTHNLTLSAPYLSFDAADTGDSMARVGWDFVKGMIIYTQEADDGSYRVKKIEKITPLNSPFIGMKVPLSRAPGSVSKIGEVQFDIKEGDHFTNNLVVNGMGQEMISNFFKRRFVATPDDQRIYKLGTISNYENQQFQPEKFDIRTMGAPNTESRGSQDEGDGAVVLFVQMKDSDSKPVEKETDWLLADGYSSALIVSNRFLFDRIIRRKTENSLGNYLEFKPYQEISGSNKSWQLVANSGYLESYYYKVINFCSEDSYPLGAHIVMSCSFTLNFGEKDKALVPLCIYSDEEKYNIKMKYGFNTEGMIYEFQYIPSDNELDPDKEVSAGVCKLKLNVETSYETKIENDLIVFQCDKGNIKVESECSGFNSELITRFDGTAKYSDTINEGVNERVVKIISEFKLNDINTFVLRNLLFPDSNYFRSETAFVPGDLLLQGQLAPGSESFAVTPTEITIVAGSEYQFTTPPEVSGVKWSLSDSEKGNTNADLGHIDAKTGKYTAPQAKAITEGVRHVVVCAEKGDTKVYALVSVLAHSVNISPAYQVILPGKSSALTAESLNPGELTWTLADNPQGSALTKVSNNEYTYTAGKKNKKLKLNLERISVTDGTGTTTEAMILVRNVLLTGYIRASYDNMPENSVQLTYFPDPENAETAIPADEVEWTLLESGGATLDPETGILSCKQATDNGFAVISTKYFDEDEGALYCAIAIPLPLNTYKETILAAYSPEQS